MTTRGGEKNKEINEITVIEEKIQNKNDPMQRKKNDRFMNRNWNYREKTSDHQWAESFDEMKWKGRVSNFQKSRSKQIDKCNYESKCSDKTYWNRWCNSNKIAMAAALWVAKRSWNEERQKRREKWAMVEKKNWNDITT